MKPSEITAYKKKLISYLEKERNVTPTRSERIQIVHNLKLNVRTVNTVAFIFGDIEAYIFAEPADLSPSGTLIHDLRNLESTFDRIFIVIDQQYLKEFKQALPKYTGIITIHPNYASLHREADFIDSFDLPLTLKELKQVELERLHKHLYNKSAPKGFHIYNYLVKAESDWNTHDYAFAKEEINRILIVRKLKNKKWLIE